MNVEMKSCGYAIYAPPALRKYLEARATGNATKELLAQLSEAAMVEQQEELAKRPSADLIDFGRARAEMQSKTQC
jgi:hypothetical protein